MAIDFVVRFAVRVEELDYCSSSYFFVVCQSFLRYCILHKYGFYKRCLIVCNSVKYPPPNFSVQKLSDLVA